MSGRVIALWLRYDGRAYHGWQVQASLPTVAGTLESALAKALGSKVRVTGCGRTDAGVHALSYCASFTAQTRIPVERLPLAVNTYLPPDIAVTDASYAPDGFCAIRSCLSKEYEYVLLNSRIRDPFLVGRAAFFLTPLDIEPMKRAAACFIGTHDFAAMRSAGSNVKTTVRTVYSCGVSREGDLIRVNVRANGFLYNMARAITGTLVYAGLGKLSPEDVPEILKSGDRRLAGPTMPPEGLYLKQLWYPS